MVLITLINSATIQGIVYNADTLEPADETIVSINTTPVQRVVTINGGYSFQVTKGSYSIEARYFESGKLLAFAEEQITIVDEGNYSIDLLMFTFSDIFSEDLPTFDTAINELITKEQQSETDNTAIYLAAAPVIFIIIITVLYFIKNNSQKKKPEIIEPKPQKTPDKEISLDPELRKIIQLLRQNEGRMTQLELRKNFPLSEAKVSLMVTELEQLGLVKKFKRGRGNIIKLV